MGHLITPIENFEFNVNQLITEFKLINSKFNSQFIIEKMARKLPLVRQGKKVTNLLNNVPYTQEVIDRVRQLFDYDCVMYRIIYPNNRYNWHIDQYSSDHCYHIPLITNAGCEFIYAKDITRFHMPVGPLYKATTNVTHTFENNGTTERVHITFEKQLS